MLELDPADVARIESFCRMVMAGLGKSKCDPKKCPAHGQLQRRPKKRTHRFWPGLHRRFPSWPEYHRTLCGRYVHQRIDAAAVAHDPAEYRRITMEPGYHAFPIVPSTIEGCEVYYECGYDFQEIFVVKLPEPCTLCCRRRPSPECPVCRTRELLLPTCRNCRGVMRRPGGDVL